MHMCAHLYKVYMQRVICKYVYVCLYIYICVYICISMYS